ncbi:MAG: hypothetical protein HKM89_06890 [Gemmatimonadales bacterium]|nr:hypothetical protein [Gemmatimonadales bacterium]
MRDRLWDRLRHSWHEIWFAPGESTNLAAARIIVAAHAIWVLVSWDIASLSGLPDGFWWNVRQTTQWRFFIFPGHPGVERLAEGVALLALLAVLVGVWTRGSALIAAALLYHLGPLQAFLVHNDPHNRGFTIAVLSLVVLSASRCADAWCVRVRRGPASPSEAPPPQWEYTWPLRLMQLFVAQVYLFGFWGKLSESGLAWFTPEQLGRHAVIFEHRLPGRSLTHLGSVVADSTLLTTLGAVAVFVFELGFIATLWSRAARRIMVPAAVGFHIGILLTMQIFYVGVFHLLLFVNWSWLAGVLRERRSGALPAGT